MLAPQGMLGAGTAVASMGPPVAAAAPDNPSNAMMPRTVGALQHSVDPHRGGYHVQHPLSVPRQVGLLSVYSHAFEM